MVDSGAHMWQGMIAPNTVVHIPMGFLVAESVNGTATKKSPGHVFGLKFSTIALSAVGECACSEIFRAVPPTEQMSAGQKHSFEMMREIAALRVTHATPDAPPPLGHDSSVPVSFDDYDMMNRSLIRVWCWSQRR